MRSTTRPLAIVMLSGGIGNQLFQYAFARALFSRGRSEVMLDPSWLASHQRGVTRRALKLGKFNITLPFAQSEDMHRAGIPDIAREDLAGKVRRKLFTWRERLRPAEAKKKIFETKFRYMPSALEVGHDAYFAGNWVCPKYFEDIRTELLAELTLHEHFSSEGAQAATEIAGAGDTAVALHVRRGDFLKYEKFAECPPSYYESALAYLREKLGSVSLFVFSDDPEYVKTHIKLGDRVTFVSGRGIPDYEELILMSCCRHAIIANSTFSWWGAWLNANPDKIIVAPEHWMTGGIDVSDYVPASLGWVRMR